MNQFTISVLRDKFNKLESLDEEIHKKMMDMFL